MHILDIKSMRRLPLITASVWLVSCASDGASHSNAPAVTRVAGAVQEQKRDGGSTSSMMEDPFEYLEKSTSDVKAWEQDQTHKTIELLHKSKGYDDLLRRVQIYRNAKQPPKQVALRGAVSFSLEQAEADTMVVYRRQGKEKPVTLFRTDGGDSHRIGLDFISVSPSGKFIAIGVSEGGTEETQVRVLDARTGADHGDRSDDVRLAELVWMPDDSGYLYMRGRGRKNVPAVNQIKDLNVAVHTLGKESREDVEVVGSRAAGARIHAELEYCHPALSPDGKDVVVAVQHGINPDLRLFTKRFDKLLDGNAPWQKLYDDTDHVTSYSVGNGRLVVARTMGALGAAVEEQVLDGSTTRRQLYKSRLPVDEVLVVGADTYAVETNIATKELVFVTGTGDIARVSLPQGRSVWTQSLNVDQRTQQLVVQLRSWTNPPAWWSVSAKGTVAKPVANVTDPSTLTDAYQVRSTEIAARDGEQIPVTIIGPKNGKTAPRYIWATAYGSYGTVVGPNFTPARRIFLELGGTYVYVHVRGGGEKGRAWHEGGRGALKAKTIEDLIDALKALRSQGFADGGGIMLYGASAGGIPLGGLIDREPELVQAVAIESGTLNVTKLESGSATGALHKEEFGTNDNLESARHLRDIDAYLNIRDSVKYPAILIFAGINDARVPYWQSTKFVARLQRAQAGSQPILLRLNGGGHISGNTTDEQAAGDAEWLTFGLSHIGHPDFQ